MMNIIVLNGSPKGAVSVTMQYVAYLKKRFPAHAFEVLDVAREVGRLERDRTAWDQLEGRLGAAQLVLWAFPVYYLLVPSQYKRFIELLMERGAGRLLAGKPAAALSTSVHYFDHTAHEYVQAVSEDLGLTYLGFHSAEMMDLTGPDGRAQLERFAARLFAGVERPAPVPRAHPPLRWPSLQYSPGAPRPAIERGDRKVVIVTDADGSSPNLESMTERLRRSFTGAVEVVNLRDLDIRGGCLGCMKCGDDNICAYTDGFVEFYRSTLVSADVIVYAGAVRDRYLSSKWKQFFDRSFFNGHVPSLAAKQVGFLIEGPLAQLPHLRQALTAWADFGECHAHFLTDESEDSATLDALIEAMARRLVDCSVEGYLPPRTFLAVGGHKVLRDQIYGLLRLPFRADCRYYDAHGGFDFPQRDWRMRLRNAFLVPLTWVPPIRRRLFADVKHKMVEPFAPVLRDL